ncbi:3-oxoacyl-ACP reductase family protein [Aliarcobacter butzleri]|uniref:3-oxoacyl-ACP reductase family protein n=1 Tax=Aliarcobacter butzleri TaxID=28197 RepID=UPI0021B57E7F|nr:3-oxoacyl-ACP reductase family protein [Aliarcobacter butzleri]MCT7588129.1 3-oxoacyl-ACP reductase FabG [Aliarcobacter butzleri]
MKSKDKVVLVTGSSKGIGRDIADNFVRKGYKVAYTYNCTHITNITNSSNIFKVEMNIGNRISVQKALINIKSYFGQDIDILINNAGIAQEKPFLTITDEDWQNMLNINLQGAFRLVQEVLPSMLEKQWGRIINITSIGGQWGGFNQVHYAASKAGLISFTQSIAKIYSKYGITSNAISPGLIVTDMSENELNTDAGKEKVKNIPLGRLGTKQEISNIALFLASDEASYITGQTVNANGGMYFG